MRHAVAVLVLGGGLALAAATLYPVGEPGRQPTSVPSRPDPTDAAVREEMATRRVPGVSVAVVRGGRTVLARGYGVANVERSVPATPATVYQIGSTTKPFTATAVLMLVEDGRLSLDERAAEHLPKLPARYGEVTVRQLLTHTSGVNRDLRTGNTDDFSVDELWGRLAAADASFRPGERWEYSNTGYILLGLLVEAVAKKPYGDFLKERVFDPAGMTDTRYLAPPADSRSRAVGYDWADDAFRPSPYFSGGHAAGGLVSTVTDLAKWDAALAAGRLLKWSSLEQMWAPATLGNGQPVRFEFRGEQTSYGFGWFLTAHRGRRVATHGGTLSGFSAQVMRFVDEGLTVIVTCNGKSGADRVGHAEYLGQRVADGYAPHPAPAGGSR